MPTIKQGDDFLAAIVPMIMASQAYKNNGAIIIWNDETEGTNADDFNHTIMEILISPLAKGNGYASSLNYTHSSDLKTMQEIFQVGPLLGDAAAAGTNDLSDMFLPGTIPSTIWPAGDYNHSGTVDAADYAVWRKGLDTTYTQSDYDRWRTRFGQISGSGAGTIENTTVPESATRTLLMLAAICVSLMRSSAFARPRTKLNAKLAFSDSVMWPSATTGDPLSFATSRSPVFPRPQQLELKAQEPKCSTAPHPNLQHGYRSWPGAPIIVLTLADRATDGIVGKRSGHSVVLARTM